MAVAGFLLARAAQNHRRKQSLSVQARRCDQTDEYFGETVADPYRWLESERTIPVYARKSEKKKKENQGTTGTVKGN